MDHLLIPFKVFGDGNCIFRALSLYLYGNDTFHIELGVRCILEMALNTAKYSNNSLLLTQLKTHLDAENSERFIEWISIFCGTNLNGTIYDLAREEVMRLIGVNSWASFWHIFAITNSLDINIKQIYPVKKNELRNNVQHTLLSNTILCHLRNEKSKITKNNLFFNWFLFLNF